MATTKERRRRTKKRPVSTLGISVEAQRLRHLLFMRRRPETAGRITGLGTEAAERVLRELEEAGCGPRSEGPYTVTQAATVLGLKLRRTRTLCEERRIGTKVGDRLYLVSREDLERFGARERRSGHPGVVARAEEAAASNGHGANGLG